MSSDVSMSSDDDKPLGVIPKARATQNGHAASANGRAAVMDDEDSFMTDSDQPLSQTSPAKSDSTAPRRRHMKRKADYSSSDSDTPLASSPAKSVASASVPMPGAVAATTVPANRINGHSNGKLNGHKTHKLQPKANGNGKAKPPPKKKVKKEEEEEDYSAESEDEKPAPKPRKKASTSATNGKSKNVVPKADPDASEDEKPLKKQKAVADKTKKVKDEATSDAAATPKPKKSKEKTAKEEPDGATPKKKRGKKKEEEDAEEEEVYKWWEMEDPNGDGSIKWATLDHNGVYFPPPYERLPSDVRMKYNGKPVTLSTEAEEVAGFYGAMIETEHAQDATFNKNFFQDFKKVLTKHPPPDGTIIDKFELCDFRPMYEYFDAEKVRKKGLTTAEKKELKKAKDALEEKYTTCVLDGRKEKVGNFRIEPPGLFRGRGEHPKKGCLKRRVTPEDITINIQQGVPIPKPNMPGKWKKVIHDQTVTWLANWTENINGQHKYVFLAAGSSLKGQSDMMKFEKARELKKHVDRIRQDYNNELKSKVMADRQRATAMYFIDRLALRAGNEKGEDEADTVGCCSLRCEHVTLEQPNFIIFDFLGKDSIRYYKKVDVEDQIFKNIRIFKGGKNDDDNLFDRVTTTGLNKHLASYMKGLTAKVFRTYNASITFQQQLDEYTPDKASVQEKLNAYNKANRMVAILCNHQRSVPKTHSASMEKLTDKLRGFKYERMKLRHVLFAMDPKYKKNKAYKDDESDMDDEWIAQHEKSQKEKEIEKAERKFAKENEKLEADGKEAQKKSVLKDRLKDIEEEYDRLEQERGTGKADLGRKKAPEKIEESIEKLGEKIKTFKLQMVDREEGKEVSLGTSKINYLDPRITAAWCKIHDVPIQKIFSKTLLTKFPWAMEVESEWKF
ncbi:hypothetical protein BD410DRAFT_719554 [Rickenella mellea]|uniref:DNA topoisomerase I n=1 Tax=Rickenella mellea TaxID=50990 RepID=A0A4Y7QBN0_9AGAM|nr:hypothetical protein BD410DRAFT_719554 [Rickenella mellea]